MRLLVLFAMLMSGALTARAEPIRVMADIAPVHSLVARVMQGVGTPGQIIRHGASPHGFTMRPSEAAALEEARLVFIVGEDLTPSLPDMLSRIAPDASVQELIEAPQTRVLDAREEAVFDDHDHHGEHDHGAHDPHAWLDPENAVTWLSVIADSLSEMDPANAAHYRKNAMDASTEIRDAVAQAALKIASTEGVSFVVFHDAYQYLEVAFEMPVEAAISLSDARGPGPARLAEIRGHLKRLGPVCVFSEPQFNPGLIRSVAEEADVSTAILDPLGAHLATGPGFYTNLLNDLATNIAECRNQSG